jgi:N-acetylglucosamine-6-phosphate deacetylase
MKTLLLQNSNVILADVLTGSLTVLVEGDIIRRIASNTDLRADEELNLSNTRLFPGFIDIHIHGAIGIDVNDAGADGLHRVARYLSKNGVTAWLPTLVPDSEENYLRAIEAIDELMTTQAEREPASQVLGVHYEGPFVNKAQCGALRPEFFKTFARGDELKSLPRLKHANAVHLITLAPEIKGGVDLIEELVKQDWIISIGHTRATVEVLDRALQAGAHHLTHFMNAMSPLHHRAPGPIGWGLVNDDVTCDVVADGIHVDPLMLKLILRAKAAARVSLISDAVAPTGLGDGEYKIWGETIHVTRGRTSNERGNIAGSVITLSDAVSLMLSLGIPAEDVARMVARNPARLLRVEQNHGSIEEGKRADLTALDDEGRVRLTLVGGRVAFNELSKQKSEC